LFRIIGSYEFAGHASLKSLEEAKGT